MSRPSSIDIHPKRKQIIRDLVKGEVSRRDIAKKYGIGLRTLYQFLSDRLAAHAAKAEAQREYDTGRTAIDEIDAVMAYMRKLYASCDEWLTDPEHPDKYFLGPRGHDLDILYDEPTGEEDRNGRPITVRKKAKLSDLIAKNLPEDCGLAYISFNIADPRELVVKTAHTLTAQLELIAKIRGQIKDVKINLSMSDVWVHFEDILNRELADHPDVRRRIAKAVLEQAPDDSAESQ